MEVILAEFIVRRECLKDWKQLMDKHSARCRKLESGCLRFNVTQDVEDDTKWVLYEVYESDAAIEMHRASAHFSIYFEAAASMYLERKVRRLREVFSR